MKKIAVFGGSFDPPHAGHLSACVWAFTKEYVDEVWLVPCYGHAFKKNHVAYEHRLEMCNLLVKSSHVQDICVKDVERERWWGGKTYDLMKTLSEAHTDCEFKILVGADITAEDIRSKWFKGADLLNEFALLTAPRTQDDISSTRLREMLKVGSLDRACSILPKAVFEYVFDNQLYFDSLLYRG